MSVVAPCFSATSSLSSDEATAVTDAPRRAPSCTAARPTPPPAPSTTSSSPGCTRATECNTWKAVRWATPKAAAAASSTPSGVLVNAVADTTISSAKAPTSAEPKTRSPGATRSTPSPMASTVPANSLPGTNGGGTLIWYLSATSRTSGKLTAAAAIRTRTWPAFSSGAGNSSTVTTSGVPWAWQTAARTSLAGVVGRLGQLSSRAHALDDDGPEGLQLLVVARPLEPALEHDGQLPFGEDHVVVDVVDLAARDLRVMGDHLLATGHAEHVDVARRR